MDRIKATLIQFWYYWMTVATVMTIFVVSVILERYRYDLTYGTYEFDAQNFYQVCGTLMVCVGTVILILSINTNIKQITKKSLLETEKQKLLVIVHSPEPAVRTGPSSTIKVSLIQGEELSAGNKCETDSDKIQDLYDKIEKLSQFVERSNAENRATLNSVCERLSTRIDWVIADNILPMKDNLHKMFVDGYGWQIFSVLFIITGTMLGSILSSIFSSALSFMIVHFG